MAKKYLTLEEAAHLLGMAPDELVRLRERSEIRGFADRGTWKFKSEDVEEFARSRDADSSPEVPILDDSPAPSKSDSAIRKGTGRFNKTSDSDVRLLLDDTLVSGGKDSDPEVVLSQLGSSDSDVRLMDDTRGVVDSGSDSDVKLISTASDDVLPSDGSSSADSGSDSDVKLVPSESESDDSDSDVRLAQPAAELGASGSDSDVRLVGTDDLATLGSESDMRLTASSASSQGSSTELRGSDDSGSSGDGSSAVKLGETSGSDESSVLLTDDSGIALDTGSAMKVGGGSSVDSGITLQSLADSGISLEKVDSGISLAGPMDSGIALDADSGIALEKKKDSGITLSDGSGIRLADSGTKKGKKDTKAEKKEKGRTAPVLKMPDDVSDDDEDSTQVEVPTMDDGDDEGSYKLDEDEDTHSTANVVLFAEDEEEDVPAPPSAKSKKGRPDDSFALQEESGVEFAEAEDFSDDEDLEVAGDVMTEEGDLDEIDVFEPAEEDFDSSVQSGESHSEFAPSLAMRAAAAPAEAPWDGLTFAGLAVSGVCLLLAGVMTFDLVREMWHWDDNAVVGGVLLDWVRGMF